MKLDRGALARIDRWILSGLDHNEDGPGAGLGGRVVDVASLLQGAGVTS